MRDNEYTFLVLGIVGVGGYFLWRYYSSQQTVSWSIPEQLPATPFRPGYEPPPAQSPIDQQVRDLTMPKGISNNNPLNLRWSVANNWQGQTGADADGFAQFTTAQYGIRAAVITMVNGYIKKGYNTIAKIIGRWSPVNDPGNAAGSTQNYIDFVALHAAMGKDDIVDTLPTAIFNIVRAMIEFENGYNPYSDVTLWQGINMGLASLGLQTTPYVS